MTRRDVVIQVGLAIVALGAAWTVSQKPASRSAGDITVLPIERHALKRLRYEKGSAWAELIPAEEDGERVAWIHSSERTLAARGPATDAGVSMAPIKIPERELRGNKAAVELLAKFTPLLGTRSLGVLSADKLGELGLDGTERKLRVVTGDGVSTLGVSLKAGISIPYVRRERDGEVFILGGNAVSDLESLVEGPEVQGRLLDRQLHTFRVEADDVISIQVSGKVKNLVALPGEASSMLRLAPRETPDAPDPFAKNWHDKLWRLPAQEVLGKGEVPQVGDPEVKLRVSYQRGTRQLGFLEVGRTGRDIFLRSEHTAGWVKTAPMAEEVVLEAEKVAGAT